MKTSARDPRVYLQDILSAIALIEEYTYEDKQFFCVDTKTQDAVLRQISIIGEAAAKLSSSLKVKHPEIPWKNIVGMRNIVVHDYSKTNIPAVWIVVERDLPVLRHAIQEMLKEIADENPTVLKMPPAHR